jgi:hypothetical protein
LAAECGVDVDAGSDLAITVPSPASLAGTATDDGKPVPPGEIATLWSKVSGPGTVTFTDATRLETSAIFSEIGGYVLRLTADDGEVKTFDDVVITNNLPIITVQATGPWRLNRGQHPGIYHRADEAPPFPHGPVLATRAMRWRELIMRRSAMP